jgi:hypothetical protein
MNDDEQIEEQDDLKEDAQDFEDSEKHEPEASPAFTEKSTLGISGILSQAQAALFPLPPTEGDQEGEKHHGDKIERHGTFRKQLNNCSDQEDNKGTCKQANPASSWPGRNPTRNVWLQTRTSFFLQSYFSRWRRNFGRRTRNASSAVLFDLPPENNDSATRQKFKPTAKGAPRCR